ncbi:hypothetical protein CDAR_584981 [Caerostris darwini]|uniref:Uncharacterized protein n=1 Tax=Caerostris darwini TaxID=1538125 RepID=A0AAV4T442_9ARAC|nr:hypothetical protein CDAR_584981 [Caerostris darwini]
MPRTGADAPICQSLLKKMEQKKQILSPPPHQNLYKRFLPGRSQRPLPVGMSEEKSVGPVPQPIVAREPLSAAITNSSAPGATGVPVTELLGGC